MSSISLNRPVSEAYAGRWVQLILGTIAMMIISNPQYIWTLFVSPLQTKLAVNLATIQVTFSVLIIIQTWLSPVQGYLIERFGARNLITSGMVLSGIGWVLAGYSNSVMGLYLTYGVLCGIGTGAVYVGIIGLTVRWFPDKRGFATGIVTIGYGLGTFLTAFPIDLMLKSYGHEKTLVIWGIALAVIGLLTGLGIKEAPAQASAPSRLGSDTHTFATTSRSTAPRDMVRSPVFWLLFFMMSMMSTGGLMIISQFANFAKDFGITSALVWGLPALPLALTIDRLTNGLTRPFFGWISDRIGRENTMFVAFTLEAASILLLVYFRNDPLMFVLLSGLVFFGWGEIFTLFPSTLTDIFGERNATTNYGILYLAHGVGSIMGAPVAALIYSNTGSWLPIFFMIVGMDLLTAILAVTALKWLRQRRALQHS